MTIPSYQRVERAALEFDNPNPGHFSAYVSFGGRICGFPSEKQPILRKREEI
jgi:hypothetical protein